MNNVTTIGIDLAKSVFELVGQNQAGKVVWHKRVSRRRLLSTLRAMPVCTVAMEACAGSHHWARELRAMGHDAQILPSQHVKAYRVGQKNDYNDARAVCEAATRPQIPRVGIKTPEQQALLSVHRTRALLMRQRTSLSNCLRGLLSEFGVAIPRGDKALRERVETILGDGAQQPHLLVAVQSLYETWLSLTDRVKTQTDELNRQARQDPTCQRLSAVAGVGPLIVTAFGATMGDPGVFKNARQVSAWLGVVPKQHSSGGKEVLLGISKQGDSYLRYLLIHGARSALKVAHKSADPRLKWALEVARRRGMNKAVVALANKNARTLWALMQSGEAYRHGA